MREAFVHAGQRLRQAGIETPELDARLLLCHAAGLNHEQLIANGGAPLAPDAATQFENDIARRIGREPVSRIVGMREFYGRAFRIDETTLDPRADSETLIDAALAEIGRRGWRGKALRILDLGTGSGILLATLLAELPRATGIGLDLSPPALRIAKDNAARLRVGKRARFVASNWLEAIRGRFDLMVSNPPYLSSSDFAGLSLDVSAHDPHLALDGGEDGLDAYRRIIAGAAGALEPSGLLLLEIGTRQAPAIFALLAEAGFSVDASRCLRRDLAGRPRVILANAALDPAGAEARMSQAEKEAWKIGSIELGSIPTN